MKGARKLSAIVLAAAILSTVFAGCGASTQTSEVKTNTTTNAAATAETKEAANPLKDKMEISVAMWDIGEALPDGVQDEVRDKVYEKLNITIKPVNVTWNDYTQKLNIWAASSQLPDFFAIDAIGTANFKSWITQGIVHALPEDMNAYPDLKKLLDKDDFKAYKYPIGDVNAKYYCLPRVNHRDAQEWANDMGIQYRKDWMANVGITKEPENMDELITMLKAFTEKDPDKNGKKDTIGLTCYNAGWLAFLMMGYEPGTNTGSINTWVRDKENPGKWIPAFMTKDCLEGLKAIKKLYDANCLDMDFATLKGEEGMDKYASGKAGALAHGGNPGSLITVAEKYEKINSGKKYDDVVALMKPFKHYKDGQYYRVILPNAWSETYINASCDDKKLDRILRLYDYFISEEGFNLTHFGIEGKNWKKENGKVALIPIKDKDGKEIPITTLYPMTKMGFLTEWGGSGSYTNPSRHPGLQKTSQDMLDWLYTNAKVMDTDLRTNFIEYDSKDKATEKFDVDLIKCVMSKDVEKTWNDLMTAYKANGYDRVIADMNTKAAQMGIK